MVSIWDLVTAIEGDILSYEEVTKNWLDEHLSIPSGASYTLFTYPSVVSGSERASLLLKA